MKYTYPRVTAVVPETTAAVDFLADGGATSRAAARTMRHVVVQPSPFREGAVNIRATVLFLRPDSVWACPDTVNRAPNLPKWGLPGRGSNLLKSPADPVCLLLPRIGCYFARDRERHFYWRT